MGESARTEGRRATPVVRIPEGVESARAKLVYLSLALASEADVEDLRERLDLGLLALYPVLNALVERGLVERDGTTYRCRRAEFVY
jgi:predicted transcriptional regulator